jgi:hypothetical protein
MDDKIIKNESTDNLNINNVEKENNCDLLKFIETVYNVFHIVNEKSSQKNDSKMKLIAVLIFNYMKKFIIENKIDYKLLKKNNKIELKPIDDYIKYNNIKLYNFETININDINVKKTEDLDNFALTHIYHIIYYNNENNKLSSK